MLIGRDYLLKKPDHPAGAKFFLDTQVVPFAANVAGALEVALDRTAARAGVRPALLVATAAGLASLTLLSVLRRRRGLGANGLRASG